TDPDPKGVNVRKTPGGAVIRVIPKVGATDEQIRMRRVVVTGQDKAWFSVRLDDGSTGWMHSSVLGSCASGPSPMYAEPDGASRLLVTLQDGSPVDLLAVSGNWARMSYTNTSGTKVTGWMRQHSLLSNPRNDCRAATRAPLPAASTAPKTAVKQTRTSGQTAQASTQPPKTVSAPQKATPQKSSTVSKGPSASKPTSSTSTPKTAPAQKPAPKPVTVTGKNLADSVRKYLGVKYVWGGTTPSGFDCSGLMYYVCKQYNITIPRTSKEQATAGKYVSKSNLRPGDLVFFGRTTSGPVDHVGMYIGNDKYIHAPNPELPVMETQLSTNSFVKNGTRYTFAGKYITARRVVGY
ncbi:NlpC/P60 family protein, partial [Desulfovibrio sp. OttesenSCG-928-I05]|nr:NlpC/P60 family protein [Desulfovibrio sp. OttesenSCG-928-I05]